MTDSRLKDELRNLVVLSMEGEATEAQSRRLNELLQSSPECFDYYLELIEIHQAIQSCNWQIEYESLFSMHKALEEFAVYETIAPEIETPDDAASQELIQKVIYPPHKKRKMSKFSLFFLAVNAAAMLFVILYIRFIPVREDVYARVTEQYQAQIQGAKSDLEVGQYLGSELIKLEKGLLEIQMNNGAVVLFEAPAEISLENIDQLFLIQGKLTASVPAEGVGFTVRTPSASIIDYGTEFGVKVDQFAKTEAHVLKGNVKVGIGSNPRILEETLRLSANQAACVSGQTLEPIPSAAEEFVYAMPSPFERMAKSLGASMYLCLQSDSIASFKDVTGSLAAHDIKIDSGVSVVPGPFAGPTVKSYAFRINGSNQAIEVAGTGSIPQNPEGDYSIGCWVRFDEIGEQALYSGQVNTKNMGFRLRSMVMKDDGSLRHFSHDLVLSGTAWSVSNPETLHPGRWYFVLISREAGATSRKDMYINGKLVASKAMAVKNGTIEQFDSFRFGGDVGTCSGFKGELAEILIFPKALNGKEVRQLYEAAGLDKD